MDSEEVSKKMLIFVMPPLAIITVMLCLSEKDNSPYDCDYTIGSQSPQYSQEILELFDNTDPAVVLIRTSDKYGRYRGSGTGFFVEGGDLITNHHVIRNAYKAVAVDSSGNKYEIMGVIANNVNADVVKLKVNKDRQSLPVLEYADVTPSFGDKVVVVGHPLGGKSKITKGKVSSFDIIAERCITFQVSAYVQPGSSGSPLLNMDGKVIGIIKAKSNTKNYVTTLATPTYRIEGLVLQDKVTDLEKYSSIHKKVPKILPFRSKFSIRSSVMMQE
jgi:S1-C subfamily serine protease